MKRRLFWLTTFVAILGAWYTLPRGEDGIPREYALLTPPNNLNFPETIAAGRELFAANCAACHGAAGNGQGVTQPPFGPKPTDLTDRARLQLQSPLYLFWRVSEGGRIEPFRSQGSVMPAWGYQFSEEQRWQIVGYVLMVAR